MNIPQDPVMLLSFVNTKLRDEYPSFHEFAKAYCVDENLIIEKLKKIDYVYDEGTNQFQ